MSDLLNTLEQGRLARDGLLDDSALQQAAAVVDQIARDKIETVRVVFVDQHGMMRGKTVVGAAMTSVFTQGVAAPSTLLLKDTSHRTVFPVWSGDVGFGDDLDQFLKGAGDILMVPDPSTFRVLPWAPHSAWIMCDVVFTSGQAIPFSPRQILRQAVQKLDAAHLDMRVGLEVEFHVFKCLDPALGHPAATMPGQPVQTENLAQGYQFLTETRYDALEGTMDLIRRSCEHMGLPVRTMEVEMGPSQFEFTFDPDAPLIHADNMVMFRTLVKEVCARNGLHATFMCKPNVPNTAASGWHLHQSVLDAATGENLMMPPADGALSSVGSAWIAGLLEHAFEGCVLATPTVNGYKRYRPHQLAPNRIVWGRDNRGAMLRALMTPGDPASRLENRVAEPTANPYFFFASQIVSGLAGVNAKASALPATETPYDANARALPESLLSAIQAFHGSTFYRAEFGDLFVDYLCRIRRAEWDRYHLTVSEWEQTEYFNVY